MRIQHNITALNAHRNLTNNNSAVGKNLEKLSSGYRINRAGDDAAGLAISEKMRAQITGLQTAQKNAEDGVSLVQTAEGFLTEVHSMLNRMVELATQSANGTYSDNNRAEMQKEIGALTDEIDRISSTSNFNGTKLFTGGVAGKTRAGGAGVENITLENITGGHITQQKAAVPATAGNAKTATLRGNGTATDKYEVEFTDAAGATKNVEVTYDGSGDKKTAAGKLAEQLNANKEFSASFKATGENDGSVKIEALKTGPGTGKVTKAGGSVVTWFEGAAAKPAEYGGTLTDGDTFEIEGKKYTVNTTAPDAGKLEFKDEAGLQALLGKDYTINGKFAGNNLTITKKAAGGGQTTISLHVGESSSEDNTIDVKIKAMSSDTLGIKDLKITDAAGAKTAIDTINAAIDSVSSIRSDLGALQNRLEHTINNLGVQTENITAAESRIRDVDMAKEMMAYTKNNILVQASQAMLAQANQVPQGVLQLLQ